MARRHQAINENNTGLLLQNLPKGTDLSVYTLQQLDVIALQHHTKLRKSMDCKSPAKLFLPKGTSAFQAC